MVRPAASTRATVIRLYVEDLRALPRGRYALWGAAGLLAALAGLAAGPAVSMVGGLWGFGFVAYGVVPLAFGVVVATRVSNLRASLFAHALFTAPVTKAQVLAASVLSSLTLGALYLLATLPFVAVAAFHLEPADMLLRYVLLGVSLLAFSTAAGTLLGVLFTGRGVAAAAALAATAAVASAMALAVLASVVASPDAAQGGALALRAAHLSPLVLMTGALGLLPFGVAPASPAASVAAFALLTGGLLALAAWVFLREQGVESWEAGLPRRALAMLVLAALLASPAAVASPVYEPGGERISGAIGSSMNNLAASLALPGTDARAALYGDRPPRLHVGEAQDRELVLTLPSARTMHLTDLHVVVTADPRLKLEGATDVWLDELPWTETLAVAAERGPPPQEAYELPVLRIPMRVTATDPESLSRNVYEVHVALTFTATPRFAPPGSPPEASTQTGSATFPLLADVPDAAAHMAVAGAPALLACVLGATARRARTR